MGKILEDWFWIGVLAAIILILFLTFRAVHKVSEDHPPYEPRHVRPWSQRHR